MDYREILRQKNRSLAIILFISIVLRAIANAFFISGMMMVALVAGGLIFSGILLLLNKRLDPFVMMYLTVIFMTALCIALMFAFPCTTNYLMFFLAIFFVVLYEDIRPIVLQCVLSAICMAVFYFKYTEKLVETWSVDAMVMCLVYIASGMLAYIALCKYSKRSLTEAMISSAKNEEQRKVAENLLGEISHSVGSLGDSSDKISSSVTETGDASEQIAIATSDVSKRTLDDVAGTEQIRDLVENSVLRLHEVAESSSQMTIASEETGHEVEEGGHLVADLSVKMDELNEKMSSVAGAIASLNEENQKIISILGTLDEITDQTNLLSLNASIEAARAGEQGKGFAVVAGEIRNLSENSAQFTSEIHQILEDIAHQTNLVQKEIQLGQTSVMECTTKTNLVDEKFRIIAENTDKVLIRAKDVHTKSNDLDEQMNDTLVRVNAISESMEHTSVAMEGIMDSITDLNSNIGNVVEGYRSINDIAMTLREVSNQSIDEIEIDTSAMDGILQKKLKKHK